jgi:hypothetical protein
MPVDIQVQYIYNTCMARNTSKQRQMTAYIPFDLYEALRQSAKANRRSINSELIWALQQYVAQQEKERKNN